MPKKQIQTVRMAEIAQRLRVNPSTVSRALRGDPRIGQEVRARVQRLADELGYRPNPLVSALMANRRRRGGAGAVDVIALITSYGAGEDWRKKEVCRWEFEGIEHRARELGFRIEVFALQDYGGDPARLRATLLTRAIRGVLLGFSRETSALADFDCSDLCVAALSNYFPGVVVDRANFHGFFNVRLALDEVRQLGYRRPALIVPELNNRYSNHLWSGAFLDWQLQLPRKDRCEPFLPREGATAAEFSDWLYRNDPDCLIVYKFPAHDLLAQKGLRVPRDIGLAWLYRTSSEMKDTAGIDGNLGAVGASALDLVVERLYGNSTGLPEHPKEVLIKGKWQPGRTLRPQRKAAPPRPSRARAQAAP